MATTLFSAGLHFGSILHLSSTNIDGRDGWPLVIAVVAAFMTSALLFIVKHRSRREMFRQTALLIPAVITLLICSIPYFYEYCKYTCVEFGLY